MTPTRLLVPSFLALIFASCASQERNPYESDRPRTAVNADPANAPLTESANPVYDTPAAYEESTTAGVPSAATDPNTTNASAPAAASNGAAIIHTVVAGDTLSGISAKYKVPTADIKQANRMTKDTVVLGRKMVIPPVR